MRVVLLGPPGAGKGTLASLIKEKLNVMHISTGDMLREEMKSATALGQEVQQYVESGKLVPDDIIIRIIENKLNKSDGSGQGFMFDGFPRTVHQAEELDKILAKVDQPMDIVLYMNATLPVLIMRLTGRRVCRHCGAVYHIKNRPPKTDGMCDVCGQAELYQRKDDNEDTIKIRMAEYTANTAPIIDYYRSQGKLHEVDADKDTDDLLLQLNRIMNEQERAY